MSKVTYVYVQCIEMLHRGYGMGHRECLRYTYMASASDQGVRRQGFWDQWRPNLRESLAHLVGLIMRRAGGDASVALRVSFV